LTSGHAPWDFGGDENRPKNRTRGAAEGSGGEDMRNNWRSMARLLLAAVLCTGAGDLAHADEVYGAGKPITLIIGEPPGGGYDGYARLLARHIGRHLPGEPTIVPQNMPGAGSLNAMNYMFNVAPKDGGTFGMVQRFVIIMPLLDMPGAKFAADRLNYVGSMDQDVGVCIVRREFNLGSVEELKTRQMIVGTEGGATDITTFTNPLVKLLGWKLKTVSGYNGTQAINLAIDRGEVDGRCGISYSSLTRTTSFLKDNRVKIFLQLAIAKDPELASVPLVTDLAPNQEDRSALELLLAPSAVARPFFLPPGVPADRVAVLRAAFDATMKDAEFLADAAAQKATIRPNGGSEMQALIARIYRLSPAVVARAKELVKE
jgi:tripartite-type tricarboxylate transporter receptor subunit TctC